MCGIAGYVGDGDRAALDAIVRPMIRSLARRGPDSEGVEYWRGAVLGHRRLAILDLSEAGRQPMLSDDGQTGVVFNGCIYNFRELRASLEASGHRFRSQTDTEVLLRGYQEWGADALVERLRGMFAFAIWDDRQRKLTMVRDRLGVKPLVYAVQNGARIAFASTPAALREAGVAGGIDAGAVLEFLEFGWVGEERSIHANVRKVPAATLVEWHDGEVSERRYWTVPEEGSRAIPFADAVAQTEALLLEAVRMRLIADVPLGSLLSGGIDSALVSWAVSKLNTNLRTFTVGTPGDPADESAAACRTARALGIPHEVIVLPSGEQPALEDLTGAYGEPFACSSALAMLRVAKAVKDRGVTVLLTGDGGDDVFLGYQHHRTFLLAQRVAQRLPQAAEAWWPRLRGLVPASGALRRLRHLLDYATGGLGAVTRVHDGLPYFQHNRMLGERLQGRFLSHREIAHSLGSARRLLHEYLDYEWHTRFVAEYMTKVDGGAMHYGIEARSPLLDHVLWEFAASLPFSVRLRGGELKAVLREIVRRRVGQEVAARPKQGFTVPAGRWLASTWRPQLEAMKESSVLEEEGWLARGSLRPAIEKAIAAGRAPEQLWFLVVLEAWARKQPRRATVQTAL